jgi:putative NADH-flavin reductase
MRVAHIGATGHVGAWILAELLLRGHEVTAIVRHPEALSPHERLTARRGDVNDEAGLAALLCGHDTVICTTRLEMDNPRSLIGAVKRAGVPRVLVIGAAGTLEVAPGVQLLDTPQIPAEHKATALAHREYLNVLRREQELNWTSISPSGWYVPSERTGEFRLGGDHLLVNAGGESKISYADFAIAVVDELETPRHPRQRFTVGY